MLSTTRRRRSCEPWLVCFSERFIKGRETLVYIIDVRSKERQMSPTLGYQIATREEKKERRMK